MFKYIAVLVTIAVSIAATRFGGQRKIYSHEFHSTAINEASTPVSGDTALYTKSDSIIYKLTSASLETSIEPFDGIRQGCDVSRASVDAIEISECYLRVGSLQVNAASQSVSMGCTDCDSEFASTNYIVYASNGSSGSSLEVFLSSVAPDGQGFNAAGDVALGRIYNNSISDFASVAESHSGIKFENKVSVVKVSQANGAGSPGIYARRWSVIDIEVGPDLSYVADSSNGDYILVNASGFYAGQSVDCQIATGGYTGIFRNTDGTISTSSINDQEKQLSIQYNATGSGGTGMSQSFYAWLEEGDQIKATLIGANACTGTSAVESSLQVWRVR